MGTATYADCVDITNNGQYDPALRPEDIQKDAVALIVLLRYDESVPPIARTGFLRAAPLDIHWGRLPMCIVKVSMVTADMVSRPEDVQEECAVTEEEVP